MHGEIPAVIAGDSLFSLTSEISMDISEVNESKFKEETVDESPHTPSFIGSP